MADTAWATAASSWVIAAPGRGVAGDLHRGADAEGGLPAGFQARLFEGLHRRVAVDDAHRAVVDQVDHLVRGQPR
jgi:hypothetical protein